MFGAFEPLKSNSGMNSGYNLFKLMSWNASCSSGMLTFEGRAFRPEETASRIAVSPKHRDKGRCHLCVLRGVGRSGAGRTRGSASRYDEHTYGSRYLCLLAAPHTINHRHDVIGASSIR